MTLTTADAGSAVTLEQDFSAARLTAGGTGTLTFEAGSGTLDIATLVANTSLTLNTDAAISVVTFGEGKTISLGTGKTLTVSGAFLTPFLDDSVVNPTEFPLSGGKLQWGDGLGDLRERAPDLRFAHERGDDECHLRGRAERGRDGGPDERG